MTDSIRFIGPRGWAVLVLAGGAALSAPFLRNPGSLPDRAGSSDKPQDVDFSSNIWPDVREKTLAPPGQIASSLSDADWAELARLQSNSGSSAMPRKVTGDLPSTSRSSLPSWADRGPRIDQLVNDSIRTEPLAPTAPAVPTGLDPLRPWMGHAMKPLAETQHVPLEAGNLPGDIALASPNPDARWSNLPSTANSEAASQGFGALAGNRPFRKFEDQVEQWPDEKLSRSQVAWDMPRAPQHDPKAANPTPDWPSVSPSSVFPIADQSAEPVSTIDQTTKPDSVSAPMVSSQSLRPAPRLGSPAIEATKPSTTRPKQFIKQPAKRA